MPLKIQLKPKERVIINGAVIEGHADNRTEIVVMNNASVMRQKHILQEDQANTPCKRLYFALQMLYIDEDARDNYKPSYDRFYKDLTDTMTWLRSRNSRSLIKKRSMTPNIMRRSKSAAIPIKVESQLLEDRQSVGRLSWLTFKRAVFCRQIGQVAEPVKENGAAPVRRRALFFLF